MLLVGALLSDVHVNIYFIVFLVAFDFFAVVDVHCEVEWLVVNFLTLDLAGFGGIPGIWLTHVAARCHVLGHWLTHRGSYFVLLFALGKLLFITEVECLSSTPGESIIIVAIHF